MDGDGLRCRRAVAALIGSRERTSDGVVTGAGTWRDFRRFSDGHLATVIRSRSIGLDNVTAALHRVIGRNRQHWSRGVLNRDGLRGSRAVVAVVGCRERTNDLVALRACAFDDLRRLRHRCA